MKSSLWYLPYLKHVTPWVRVLHKHGSSVCPQALNTLTESNVDNNCNGVPGSMWIWSLFVLPWVSSNLAHLIIWVCFNAREGQLTRVSHTLWPNTETFRESLYCTVRLGDSDSQECSVRKRVSEQCRRNSKRGQKGHALHSSSLHTIWGSTFVRGADLKVSDPPLWAPETT